MNLRDKYLNAPKPVVATVEVPEWGLVRLRSLTQAELDRVSSVEKENGRGGLLLSLVLGVVDEQGRQVFTEDDLDALKASVPFTTVLKIVKALGAAMAVTAESVSEAKNGSGPTPT